MQFSIAALLALAATASANAVYYPRNANGTTVIYPTGTGAVTTGTGSPTKPTASFTQSPYTGAATYPTGAAGSVLGMVVAGGVALMI
jgi:hypothetical protein